MIEWRQIVGRHNAMQGVHIVVAAFRIPRQCLGQIQAIKAGAETAHGRAGLAKLTIGAVGVEVVYIGMHAVD